MYESFFGLKEKPFNLLPDPDYLYMSAGHENIFTHLDYSIAENKGFVVITGEVGSGKTTLINYLISKSLSGVEVGLINNTYIAPNQVIKSICREFELETDHLDRDEMLDRFHSFLIDKYAQSKRVILIFDEAQNLSVKSLEEIRMLSNLEAEKHHLIQIILAGQPELKARLRDQRLKQFVQRVAVYSHLEGLPRSDVQKYITYRLTVAGADDPNIFGEKAIDSIASFSQGIPRVINILCDAALVYAFADNKKKVDSSTVEEVIRERSSSGIFDCIPTDELEKVEEEWDAPGQGSRAFNRRGLPAERLETLEVRVQNLETMLKHMEKRLNTLSAVRDEKDEVILELFKLLKNSLENRYSMLMNAARIKSKEKRSARPAPPPSRE